MSQQHRKFESWVSLLLTSVDEDVSASDVAKLMAVEAAGWQERAELAEARLATLEMQRNLGVLYVHEQALSGFDYALNKRVIAKTLTSLADSLNKNGVPQ